MPRIDPQQLLKCLAVLLSPQGGVKSQDEVQRLASLMTKFSKKLVSKCIYVSILKATETDLLVMFMSAGGWDLTYNWLSDGVTARNWPLVTELVELLLMCPVDIDRLKTNACPKLIKMLSKDVSAAENVRVLACQLVEQWLRVVRRGDDKPPSEQPPPEMEPTAPHEEGEGQEVEREVKPSSLPVYKITIRDGKTTLAEVDTAQRTSVDTTEEESSTGTEDINPDEEEPIEEEEEDDNEDDDDEDYVIKPVKLRKKPAPVKRPAKVKPGEKKERVSTDSGIGVNKQKDKPAAPKKGKSDQTKPKDSPKNKTSSNEAKVKESGVKKNAAVSKESETNKPTSSKPKDKLSLSLKNRKSAVSNKDREKNESKFAKLHHKEKKKSEESDASKTNDIDMLTEKEKESLSKFITPPISKLGKIPKKTSANKEEKQSEERNRTLKDDISSSKPESKKPSDNKLESKRPDESKSELKKKFEIKKPPETKKPEKNFTIGAKRSSEPSDSKPKTVKTYNSKFRSTGLEEEVLQKPAPKAAPTQKKPSVAPFPPLSIADKKLTKRTSPPPPEVPPEKKLKPENLLAVDEKKTTEKVGGIKLIPPKPKPMFLQESDVFMDAMLAANTMKEPRKRKRRISSSKDPGPSEPKKEATSSPTNSPKRDETSPSSIKPTFKFYQETLDTSLEDEKSDVKSEDESFDCAKSNDEDGDDQKSMSSEESTTTVKVESENGTNLKGVLIHLKTKRQKKTVTWKEDGLVSIRTIEKDATERVNVYRNFTDMKNMERDLERENFMNARKLAVDDTMEERIRWRPLVPIDVAATVVPPGKNSQEKDIQYAREKTVAPAIYFNKRTIPDSPAEPDLEIHATTDPTIIPLDDVTGSSDTINDFTDTPWPEPLGQPPIPPGPPPPTPTPAAFPPTTAPPMGFPPGQPAFPPMGPPFMPGPMPPPGDCWRTGDGKVVGMPPEMFPPGQGPMIPMMVPPGVMPPPDMMPFPMPMPGPNPSPEDMVQAHFAGGFPPMGPPGQPGMFQPPLPPPPQGPSGNNWPNQGGNWYDGNSPPHNHNDGPPGRYQGQGGGWRGGGNRGNRNPDNWGGGNNRNSVICRNFLKRGICRTQNCRFRHYR